MNKCIPILLALALLTSACGQVVVATTPTAERTALPTAALSLSTAPPKQEPTPTFVLSTPTPVNTPTPTATPIVHQVQSGETLISIALEYNVSVAALQTANGISDPQMLQIGQSLIIPTGEQDESPALQPLLPTATALPLDVRNVSFYETPVGSLWCLGQVFNANETALENVKLRVTLHNAAGETLTEGISATALDFIPSGSAAPFGILFTTPPPEFDRFLVTLVRADSTNNLSERYAALELLDVSGGLNGAMFQVDGRVQNVGPGAATGILVVVTTFDKAGLVTGFRQARLPNDLPASDSADFSISLMPNNGQADDYEVVVQGRLAAP